MITEKLSPCANLLYHWIKLHLQENRTVKLNLRNFQAWTGEFLESSASMREIQASLSQLKSLDLIAIEGMEVRIKNSLHHNQIKIYPLPPNLITKTEKHENNNFLWVLVMSLMCLIFGSFSTVLYWKLAQVQGNFPVITNPYQVLAEID